MPVMLQSMGSQRVKHDWSTELNWILTGNNTVQIHTYLYIYSFKKYVSTIYSMLGIKYFIGFDFLDD